MMKKLYFLLYALLVFTGVNAQILNIPDWSFKQKLLHADYNNEIAKNLQGNFFKIDANYDGEIQVSEALEVTYLFLEQSDIYSLEGISNFNNLQELYCKYNHLTSLDLSSLTYLSKLDCENNQLNVLNISGLTHLETLQCGYNQLTSLNTSGLVYLGILQCNGNQLLSLNVSGLTNLVRLYCSNNQITSLNISGLTNLEILYCNNNQIPFLNVTGLTDLILVGCANNQISSLNLSGLTNLILLDCSFNQIPSLNLSGLANLHNLDCSYNQIPSLNVSGLTNLVSLGCSNNELPSLNVSGLINLLGLNCSNNQIPSLNVSGLTNLSGLNCSNNQIPLLNLSGLTNLTQLNCSFNQIPSLNVSGLTNLETLDCSHNLIPSLDLSGFIHLFELNCSYNQLPSLNLNGLTHLGLLDCSQNQLTSLNVSGSPDINFLYCSHNQIPSLDLSGLAQLQELNCDNNSPLVSLLLKNGANESQLNFANNPSLQYICSDESQITQIQDQITLYGYTNCTVNSYCTFIPGGAFYTIQGNQKWDSNNNGSCDVSDAVVPNLKFTITDGTTTGSTISNETGAYSIPVQAGTHTITPVLENPNYFTISPTSATVEFPTVTSPFVQDFCFTSNGVHPDLEVIVLPLGVARPGFDVSYQLLYKNKGNTIQSGSVNFTFDDAVLDFVSATPVTTAQILNNLSWTYTNLLPFETREINFTLNLNSPMETPAVNSGDVLDYTATITSAATDETPDDNTLAFNQAVVNSFDPNDKTCLEGTTLSPSMIGEYVHYMIRFENTGTFPAENIVVKDMIDLTKFDISTLVPIQGSHSFVTKITDGNKVEFIFENINLPFDNANNDGFVAFKIKTLPTLVLGDTFENTANIYFDYNFPIVTNTATTTIQTLGTSDFEFSKYFTLYPNPAKEVLNIAVKNGVEVSSINIYNTLGQLVIAIPNAQTVSTIDVSRLTTGNYFIKMTTDKGTSNAKFIMN